MNSRPRSQLQLQPFSLSERMYLFFLLCRNFSSERMRKRSAIKSDSARPFKIRLISRFQFNEAETPISCSGFGSPIRNFVRHTGSLAAPLRKKKITFWIVFSAKPAQPTLAKAALQILIKPKINKLALA